MIRHDEVDACVESFTQLLTAFHQFRDALKEQKHASDGQSWFHVEDGLKPWIFDVDWLAITYRFRLTPILESSQGRPYLYAATIQASIINGTDGPATMEPLQSGRLSGQFVDVEGRRWIVSVHAAELFFSLTRASH